MVAEQAGKLFVVATPIGNLSDLSPRARLVLEQVDLIAAEDTRRTGQLLTSLGLRKPLLGLHEHNELERSEELLAALQAGKTVALVSDAGTPLVSDPGYRLLAAARRAVIPVSPVPGPSAALAALSVAGLPTDRFHFEGFLPAKSAARLQRLAALATVRNTMIFFEAVHRIDACLADLAQVFGPDRPATLAREVTKLHETFYRGSLAQLRAKLGKDPGGHRGEFTLVVAGHADSPNTENPEIARIFNILVNDLPPGKAASLTAKITGARRGEIYRLMRLSNSE